MNDCSSLNKVGYMRCKSCKEDVPPKFTHALSVNICPLCGKEIMEIKLQNILGELKVALGDAKDYMEEVEDWLFSNFSLKKVLSNQVVIDKSVYDSLKERQAHLTSGGQGAVVHRNEIEVEDNIVMDEPSTVFAKRAGVPNNHKKTIDFIKGRVAFGAADPSEFQGVDDEYGNLEPEQDGNTNPLNVNERKQMQNIFGEDKSANQELELQKLKKLKSQDAVSGGGGGFFRRG